MIWLLLLLIIPAVPFFLWVRKWVIYYNTVEKLQKTAQEEREKQKRERENQEFQKHMKEEDEKILFMQDLGLEEVIGVDSCTRWIFRDEDGKIKSLYDLESNRVPLAELVMAPGAKTIGIIPDLYYYGEKISRWQMLEDEEEIRKLNAS